MSIPLRKNSYKNISMKRFSLFFITILLLITGCADPASIEHPLDGDSMERPAYLQIDQEQAKYMMQQDDGHVIVDVRRQDEYDAGHIPGAILIPNESIGTEPPKELPDFNQIILVYCRSGNRSKQAAEKLDKRRRMERSVCAVRAVGGMGRLDVAMVDSAAAISG